MRRSLFLVVLGFADAMLFYVGDILAAYGVLLFLGVWVLRRRTWVILAIALFFFALGAIPGGDVSMATSTEPPDAALLPPDLVTAFERRIVVHPIIALLGITAAIAGALPVSLVLAGVVDKPATDTFNAFGVLHDAAGVPAGFGYAALIVLIAVRLGRGAGPISRAISAVGQRSLTCYLIQSVVWTIVFTPYLLDLSDDLTVTTTAVLAFATWLSTVFLAAWMDRASYRGPFEVLIRRFTYWTGGT